MVNQKTKVGRKRKHVTQITINKRGVTSWELLDAWGDPIIGYSLYMDHLIKKGDSFNTRRAYARAISQFYDYLTEVTSINGGLTEQLLEEASEAYEVYMVIGENTETYPLVEEVLKQLPSPKIKPKSYDVHHAALQGFLRLSAKTTKHLKQLERAGFSEGTGLVSELPLFDCEHRELSHIERRAIIKRSVFAATISGGAKTLLTNVLERKYPSSTEVPTFYDKKAEERTFPWDRFQDLLDAAPNIRAKLLWSLIAATGCRFSEAVTILNSDIDVKRRKIYLEDPKSRPEMYPNLTSRELDKFGYKSRATSETFIIYWGKKFFEYLLEYRKSAEYVISVKHDFLFQSLQTNTRGEPLALHSYASCLNTFQSTVRKVITENSSNYGFHSLRHMYGFYLKNYAPRANGGEGFELSEVQTYMGHSDQKYTKLYALEEKEKHELAIIYANEAMTGRLGPETLLNLKLKRNQREREKLLAEAHQRHIKIDNRFMGEIAND